MAGVFDRVRPRQVVMLCCLNAIKEDKPISSEYFKFRSNYRDPSFPVCLKRPRPINIRREMLESNTKNGLQDPEFKFNDYAQRIANMPAQHFDDQFDRAFVGFQTDKGVTKLATRFDSDIDDEPDYNEDALYGETMRQGGKKMRFFGSR